MFESVLSVFLKLFLLELIRVMRGSQSDSLVSLLTDSVLEWSEQLHTSVVARPGRQQAVLYRDLL